MFKGEELGNRQNWEKKVLGFGGKRGPEQTLKKLRVKSGFFLETKNWGAPFFIAENFSGIYSQRPFFLKAKKF